MIATSQTLAGIADRTGEAKVARRVPLLGSLPYLMSGGLDFILKERARLGDIFAVEFGAGRVLALCHPSHAQHVLRDSARKYEKGGPLWDSVRGLLGNGLPVSEGDFWLRQRRMLQPQFHRQRLQQMSDTMVAAIDDCLQRWQVAADSGRPLDVAAELTHMTMQIVVRTMFGASLDAAEVDTVARHMGFALSHVLHGVLFAALPSWLPVPGRRRFAQAVAAIDKVLYRVINQRRQSGGAGGDMIGMLIDMVDDETGERMSEQALRDEAMSLFLAGYETTAAALSFTFNLLAEQPALAAALRTEAAQALGGERPTLASLRQLTLSRATMQEALRLYPPAYWLPRRAVEDDVIDGVPVPAGTVVAVMIYAIHRNPDLWPEPARFSASRFTPAEEAQRHPLSWMPFGAGQRVCIGKEFALMEGQLILTRALARFQLAPVPGRATEATVAATLRPRGGVWLTLSRVTAAALRTSQRSVAPAGCPLAA